MHGILDTNINGDVLKMFTKKIKKLIKNPNLYFYDYFRKKLNTKKDISHSKSVNAEPTDIDNKIESPILKYYVPKSNNILISHFYTDDKFSNGVTNYIDSVVEIMKDSEKLSKPYPMNDEIFRNYILNYISWEIFESIEVAESQASAVYLPRQSNIHIRMHCPFYLYKKIINEEVDEQRFSTEVRAMYKAKVISSPSHGMLEYLDDELRTEEIFVFKNPCPNKLSTNTHTSKNYDVCFYGRFNNLKGNQFFSKILQHMPKEYKILVLGKEEQKIKLKGVTTSNIEFCGHVEGEAKFNLLRQSKVMISLSKFENCSMAILESLSVGVPVVCWDVGGNAEIAGPEVLRAIPIFDIGCFVREIIYFRDNSVDVHCFTNSIKAINQDFINGLMAVRAKIQGENNEVYKGLDCRAQQYGIPYSPYQLSGELPGLPNYPINILVFTNDKYLQEIMHTIGRKTKKNISCIDITKRTLTYDELKRAALSACEKPDVLILEKSYGCKIDFIRQFRREMKSILVFTQPSPVNKGAYILDPDGFDQSSLLWKTRIKTTNDQMDKRYSNCLLLINEITIENKHHIKKIYDEYQCIYVDKYNFASMKLLYGNKTKQYNKTSDVKYCIESLDDIELSKHISTNTKLICRKSSFYYRKDCTLSKQSRALAKSLIETKEISKTTLLGLHVIAEQLDYLCYL